MMEWNLRPYPEYKDSGLPWLGEIPGYWKLMPNRSLFFEVKERNCENEQMLSVTIAKGVIKQAELLAGTSKKDSSNLDKSKYKLVLPGDLAYNKMRAWQGAVGVSSYRGIVSPAYIVVRLRESRNPRYFHYLFRIPAFAKEAERWSYGITSDQWSLRSEDFKQIYCSIPPFDEQSAIVRFLDHIDRRIRRYIRAKKKLVALLNEQKQAIIQRAVTRGLDPDVRLKPSGVEWLGDIPEHWEVKRTKYFFREVDERSITGAEELLSVSHLTGVTPRSLKNVTMFKAESYIGHKLCKPGNLVINTMWAWMAALGISFQVGIVSPSYAVYRLRNMADFFPEFIDFLLRIKLYSSEFHRRSTGIRSSRLRLYPDEFFKIPIFKPPLDEQIKIVDFVKKDTARIDTEISSTQNQIALLQEYRTRLIADVVTGKLDVREIAKNLPEEDDEPEIEENEDLPEDNSEYDDPNEEGENEQ